VHPTTSLQQELTFTLKSGFTLENGLTFDSSSIRCITIDDQDVNTISEVTSLNGNQVKCAIGSNVKYRRVGLIGKVVSSDALAIGLGVVGGILGVVIVVGVVGALVFYILKGRRHRYKEIQF